MVVINLLSARRAGRVWIMLELRTLEPNDWPLWRELRLAALAEAPYAFGSTLAQWQGSGDREERWRARLSIPGAHDLVALLDGLPVGMASGVPGEGAENVELISMWVNPTARGKGVGDYLIQAVERWGAERGATTLRLSVMPDNRKATALYERHGFTDTGHPGDLLPMASAGSGSWRRAWPLSDLHIRAQPVPHLVRLRAGASAPANALLAADAGAFATLCRQDAGMACVLVAPVQVVMQRAGLDCVVGVVRVGEGELPQRPEVRLAVIARRQAVGLALLRPAQVGGGADAQSGPNASKAKVRSGRSVSAYWATLRRRCSESFRTDQRVKG